MEKSRCIPVCIVEVFFGHNWNSASRKIFSLLCRVSIGHEGDHVVSYLGIVDEPIAVGCSAVHGKAVNGAALLRNHKKSYLTRLVLACIDW